MGISAQARPAIRGTVIAISGDVDDDTAATFEELLLTAARRYPRPLMLDLSGVDSIDRSGLAALLTITRLAAARDRTFRVIATSRVVRALADVTGTRVLPG